MRILLVVAHYYPEIGSASHLYQDIARALTSRGHLVSVVTSAPRECYLADSPMHDSPREEVIDGVRVYRVDTEVERDNFVKRGMEHFWIPFAYYLRIREIGFGFDACLLYIPPLPLYRLGIALQKKGIRVFLHFQDFHPQELTDVGVLSNPLLVWLMQREERRAYSSDCRMVVLNDDASKYVMERGLVKHPVEVVFNSFGSQVSQKDMISRKSFDCQNMELVYAGIISPFQGLDRLLDLSRRLPNVTFSIIGDGIHKIELQNRVADESIGNVRFLPVQPREKYMKVISEADINLVTLDKRMLAPCLPGKIASLLAVGKPILFLANANSATSHFVKRTGIGALCDSDDLDSMVNAIDRIAKDSTYRLEMIRNQEMLLQNEFNPDKNIERLITLFSDGLSGP